MTLADGKFDPIHVGHLRYLRGARLSGAPLYVRVANDGDIRAAGRAVFQSRAERAETLWAFDCVDRVVTDDTLAAAILRLKPDTLAKGIEWRDRLPADVLRACQQVGTRIVYVNERHKSSSQRLSRLYTNAGVTVSSSAIQTSGK